MMNLTIQTFSRAMYAPEYYGSLQILEIGFYTMKTRLSWVIIPEKQQ